MPAFCALHFLHDSETGVVHPLWRLHGSRLQGPHRHGLRVCPVTTALIYSPTYELLKSVLFHAQLIREFISCCCSFLILLGYG